MPSPMQLARQLERRRPLPQGVGERFSGYGVLGLAFESGHVLALRRFVASSIGPPFTSVWHRDPQERWTFYVNADAEYSCPRYFGPALHDVQRDEISIAWLASSELAVHVTRAGLHWALRLTSTPITRALSSLSGMMPDRMWRAPGVPDLVGAAGGVALGTGPLRLRGRTPTGMQYLIRPSRLLLVAGAAAVLANRELGNATEIGTPAHVGEFRLPQRPLFAFGTSTFQK